MRVLELGSYIAPAYAGMILAEQGHAVEKWIGANPDPTQRLIKGDELWQWLNHGKRVVRRHAGEVTEALGSFDAVIDNLRASTWKRWSVDPEGLAKQHGVTWVSLRADVGDTSFDILAQARSWMEYGPWVPFYLGDTAAGLWLAFKALSAHQLRQPGHYVIYHGAALQKLVEGELVVERPSFDGMNAPWDRERYGIDKSGVAEVEFRGRKYREPPRDRAWKLRHFRHTGGRIII